MVFVGLGRFLRRSLNSKPFHRLPTVLGCDHQLHVGTLFFFFAVADSSATLAGNQPTFGGSFVWNPLGCWNTGEKVLHHRRAQTWGQEKVILVFFLFFLYFFAARYCIMVRMRKLLYSLLELMGRNWSLLQETFPPKFKNFQKNFSTSFGLFAMLSTPKKSLRVR